MDRTLRQLERRVAVGDSASLIKLKVVYRRLALGGNIEFAIKLDALCRRDEQWNELDELRAHRAVRTKLAQIEK